MRAAVCVLVLGLLAGVADAEPAPYTLPWQLRAAAAGNVVRSDSVLASYEGGSTFVSSLYGSWKLRPTLAPFVRIAMVRDTTTSVSNPLLGVVWSRPLAPPFKLAVMGAVTVPIGAGDSVKAGAMARSSMDNALFATNDVAAIAGGDLAWVAHGVTLQAEATLFELVRVRNADVQMDAAKTNLTTGVYAGWAVRPWLSGGIELRYQRYLTTPAAVAGDGTLRDNLTAAIGLRTRVDLGGGRILRPGLAYAHGLDDPMLGRGYDVVQLDLPLSF